jgi:hypothetical protein
MMEYEDWYKIYPRKQAGALGRAMWNRLTEEEKVLAMEALPNHVAMWEAEGRDKHLIPLPATWLNPKLGRRWEDEIELPKPKEMSDQWWTSEHGIERKAKELGVSPRPGESWFEVKGRVNDAIRKTA